ncbi:MAG TPA: TonB C-terminal domain-containing protein [Allosphingosinicella sp.]|nr:TonB C-terminal domain-containing protein [Allosphingosinicella sp.]
MDRAEATGFGVATAGHLALLAALTFGLATTQMPVAKSDAIEVSFVEDVGLESTAPAPSAAEPAPLLAPEEGPPEPAMPAPPQVQPAPQPPVARAPAPTPAPTPKPAPRAATPKPAPAPARPTPRAAQPKAAPSKAPPAKAAPAKAASAAKGNNARPTGRLSGLLTGVSDRKTESRSTATPAAAAGPAVQASLGAEIRRQIKPHWKAPTGADSEQLRTEVIIALAQDGRVTDIRIVGTTGQTASNRPQVPLHREHAERAVRLASPFKLPAQYYDAWKSLRFNFDKRLSQ